MARRVVYTNPLTGKFISAAEAFELEGILRSVYDGGLVERQILDFGATREDLTQSAEPNWIQEDSRWGQRWSAGDDPLSLSALGGADFPSEFDSFRVTFNVADNPDYPRKFGSSEWMTPEMWPPSLDLLEGVAVTGIAQIVFRSR